MSDHRREFDLPTEDEEFLNSLNLNWETLIDNESQWLIVHDWAVPQGYTVDKTNIALLIPNNYAESQIDCVYVKPDLAKVDSGQINNLTPFTLCSETWQQWSRHRTPANPWKMDEDNISTHLSLVDDWFRREIK